MKFDVEDLKRIQWAIAALVVALLILVGLSRRHAAPDEALPEPLVP